METKTDEFDYSKRTSKTQKFDPRLVTHIVQLAEKGIPRKDLSNTYGVTCGTVGAWIAKHSTILSKRRIYTLSEKRSVVRAVNSGMSVRKAMVAYNISSKSSVLKWIKNISEENTEISISNPIEMPKNPTLKSENAEIIALRKALEEANMKNRALNTLIDVAEEQLKIDIRKKSGARQSSK